MAPSDGRDWYVECAESPTIVKQELEFSCGAACARQLLADEGIDISEDEIRGAAAFEEGKGIYALSLAIALDQLMPNTNWNGVSVNEDSLDALLQRAPFIAMLDRHWVFRWPRYGMGRWPRSADRDAVDANSRASEASVSRSHAGTKRA